MGFKMSLRYESFGQQINLLMRGAMTYQIELSSEQFDPKLLSPMSEWKKQLAEKLRKVKC
jgi:hypothetical protein